MPRLTTSGYVFLSWGLGGKTAFLWTNLFWTPAPSLKGFEANGTRKFTRKFGKSFVAQVLWGTFSVLDEGFLGWAYRDGQSQLRDSSVQIIGAEYLWTDFLRSGAPGHPEWVVSSGFRKRGRQNGVASEFFLSSVFFRFLPCHFPFSSVVFFPVSMFFLFVLFFFSGSDFSVFFFFPFSSVSFSKTNGETPFARPLLWNPDKHPRASVLGWPEERYSPHRQNYRPNFIISAINLSMTGRPGDFTMDLGTL